MSFGDSSDDRSEQESTHKKQLNECRAIKKPLIVNKRRLEHDNSLEPAKKRNPDNKKHVCPEPGCDATFSRPYRLKHHLDARHAGKKPFSCTYEDCNKSYTNPTHLKRHEVTVHIGDDESREVVCGMEDCGMIFSNKYNLKRHIARAHTKLPFQCHLCPEKFAKRNILNSHKIETHGLAAPYICKYCPETFIKFHAYQKHVNRHRNYKCDCGNSYGKWTEYCKHKRTECVLPKAEHVCVICDKKFSLKQNLTKHAKVHLEDSQVEEYKCPYVDCCRAYKYKKNLTVHIKTFHQKLVEHFSCPRDNCTAVLKSKKNLKQHLRTHSDKPLKEKTRRKPRKDKGVPKNLTESTAFKLSVPDKDWHQTVGQNKDNTSKLVNYIKNILYGANTEADVSEGVDNHSQISKEIRITNDESAGEANRKNESSENGRDDDENDSLENNSVLSPSEEYKCPYVDCSRAYNYKKNLAVHIKTFHQKFVEHFSCPRDNCTAVLKSKKNFKQHLRTHNDKPLKEKTHGKPRKDKGVPKNFTKSTAFKLAGPNKDRHQTVGQNKEDTSKLVNYGTNTEADVTIDESAGEANKKNADSSENGRDDNENDCLENNSVLSPIELETEERNEIPEGKESVVTVFPKIIKPVKKINAARAKRKHTETSKDIIPFCNQDDKKEIPKDMFSYIKNVLFEPESHSSSEKSDVPLSNLSTPTENKIMVIDFPEFDQASDTLVSDKQNVSTTIEADSAALPVIP